MIWLFFGLFGLLFVTYWLNISLVGSVLLLMMFFVFFFFDKIGFVGVSWFFGVDLMSLSMVVISFWIVFLMLLSFGECYGLIGWYYSMVVVIMMLFLFLSFVVVDLLMFYIFFESVLIPTVLLIVGWGYQPERLRAGMYMLFYTLVMSLPLLLSLLNLYYNSGSVGYFILFDFSVNGWWVYFLLVAFLVKLPIYFFHLWLPRAHVEAPVGGSMILAGVLLKLGGYGLFRIYLLISSWLLFNSGYLLGFSLIGGFFMSLVCMVQIDIKMLVAYSSVVHMSLVLGGLITCTYVGFYGGLIVMLAHGLCSSCLFCLVNVLYERMHSRSVVVVSGMLVIYPCLGLWWFLLCIGNMSAPFSFGLVGELMLMVGLISYSWLTLLLLCGISFFSAVFSLYLFNVVQHGKGWFFLFVDDVKLREYLLFFLHWFPLNVMFMSIGLWSEWL